MRSLKSLLKEALDNEYISKKDFKNEFGFANYLIVDLDKLRSDEETLEALDLNDKEEFSLTLEGLFDDEWKFEEFPKKFKNCIYLKLVKMKPDAPKGAGTEFLKEAEKSIGNKGSVFVLYASPIPEKKLSKKDSEEFTEKSLPRLLAFYERLGYKSQKTDKQIMFRVV